MEKNIEKSRKTKFIGIRVNEKKYEEINKYAEDTGISISSLVAIAVSEYLKKNWIRIIYGGNLIWKKKMLLSS